jgi:hypothetical protein
LFLGLCALGLAGCGEEPRLYASFTSQIVQRESCRQVGDAGEGCTREDVLTRLRVHLVETTADTIWLYGLPRGGVDDRAILGTRSADGGFLFVEEAEQINAANGCVLTTRLQLALSIEPDDLEAVGVDACVPLVGRHTETNRTSAECDNVGVPPQPITRTARKRWERLPVTAACE